jgi:alpha-L-fucosidase 2
MTNSNVIWLEQPAATWDEALPLGNGRLGAMVFGDVHRERIPLNEDTLWSGEPVAPLTGDYSEALADVRAIVFARKYAEASAACERLQGGFTESYLPLGDLWLDFAHDGETSHYRRDLNLETATATVEYRVGDVAFHR